jgi:hypothetical protein
VKTPSKNFVVGLKLIAVATLAGDEAVVACLDARAVLVRLADGRRAASWTVA